ncbi:hypothetical protein [Pluralibacter gergoviae]|uniref:hypothetical protein n=1 Tax=Pluralibacter gergoviae TaxID=61647 RepID=UPI0012FF32F1|nr:hypothetical protein [Pluralibacter gergoviae]
MNLRFIFYFNGESFVKNSAVAQENGVILREKFLIMTTGGRVGGADFLNGRFIAAG